MILALTREQRDRIRAMIDEMARAALGFAGDVNMQHVPREDVDRTLARTFPDYDPPVPREMPGDWMPRGVSQVAGLARRHRRHLGPLPYWDMPYRTWD